MQTEVEVTNGFNGLDLIATVPKDLWTEVPDIVQEEVIKTILKKKKCEKAKGLSEEPLQIAEKRSERQRRKGKIYPFECRVPKKAFLSDHAKKWRKTREWEKLEISSRKLEIPREYFMQRCAQYRTEIVWS